MVICIVLFCSAPSADGDMYCLVLLSTPADGDSLLSCFDQHPQLMSGEEADERKANVLKQSLDYLDIFLESSR